jgi:DNA-binding winged helix-turn-helix (wHTH) protein/TolB-like protein/Flp pilus assembly protein TadD
LAAEKKSCIFSPLFLHYFSKMNLSNNFKSLREFGQFRLDVEKKVLWHAGNPVKLQLKEIELLCVLTENNRTVFTKDELLSRVWANSFVEEGNLSRHIYQIRKTLKEYGATEEIIQTVPRRGYRFAGEVREIRDALIVERLSVTQTLIEELEDAAPPNAEESEGKTLRVKRRRFFLTAFVSGVLVLAAALGFYFNDRRAAAELPIRSVAVLPLKSLSSENDKPLSLGFSDALITNIGKFDNLRIISTNAVSAYTDEHQEPLVIGQKLGVDAVLDGTLQRAGKNLRVTLRLFRIADGRQIWSETFDDAEDKIFSMQDAMAQRTAQALSLNLKPREREKLPTENLEAYQLYLQARYLFRQRQPHCRELFEAALKLDPQFAKARAGLAGVYAMAGAMPEAETNIDRALEIEPDLAEAHAVRGFVKMFLNWDWAEAEESLNRALELDPNSVEAHHWRGIYLTIHGRFGEAEAEMKRALELDPASANMISDLGQIYYFDRQYDKAEELYRKANLLRDKISDVRLTELYVVWETGKKAETEAAEQLNVHLERLADKTISEKEISGNWHGAAICYLRLGEREKAIESLERAMDTKTPSEIMNFTFPFIGVNPQFTELRGDARFQRILRRVNL